MHSFQKNTTFCVLLHSFAKEYCVLCLLLRSLQNNVAFFAFFYILCKRSLRSLRSFMFLRKERKRMHRSFGFHKSPKTRKKNAKERCVQNVKERGVQPWRLLKFPKFIRTRKKVFFWRLYKCLLLKVSGRIQDHQVYMSPVRQRAAECR